MLIDVPDGIETRQFQLDGIDWLRTHHRGMILDEPGMGKTMQAIYAADTPVLVACPGYLVEQWRDEIQRLRPGETISTAQGERWERLAAVAEVCDWTIINIEMLRKYTFKRKYQTFVVDESHHLKGHDAIQSVKARALAKGIPNVFMLTATPIKRECDDLFMQLSILDSKRFTSYNAFVAEYCKSFDNGFKVQVVGARHPGVVRQLLAPYAIRRTYASTGLKRNEPINRDVILQPSPTWRKVYKELKKNYRLIDVNFDTASEVMRTLRRMTLDLKMVSGKAIFEDNPGTIFYVYYRESAHQLGEYLKLPVITGEMAPNKRAATAKATNKGVVATIKSLSEGIDLTHFNNICYIETSYIPGDLTQATARLVRWNLNIRPVRVFHVRVKDSVDTTIHSIITRRDGDEKSILREELMRVDDD